jgi:hypothetical protein
MGLRRDFLKATAAWATAPVLGAAPAGRKTRNVIVVMSDGLRWQEVFRGTDRALLNKESGAQDVPEASREALFPFLWGVVARQGQIFGNRDKESEAFVTNGLNFSYPGYSEALCGFGDPRVDSNDKKHNPNINVLEWLNRKPDYAGRVAAFGAWELFPWILNAERSGLLVNAGYEPLNAPPVTERVRLLNRLKRETEFWEGESFDAPTFLTAMEYFRQHKPRVLFVSLGETDEWAHDGRYDLYLKSAHRFDQYVGELWQTAQSMAEYRGTTSLILAVDHGRGEAPTDWKGHGEKLPDSKYVWMGFLGPDTRGLGEREKAAPVTQSQIAATIAALLGEDFTAGVEQAGKPIPDVF